MADYIDEKPQFNMANNFINRLDRRLDEKDRCLAVGDLVGAYRLLQGIYATALHFKFLENKDTKSDVELKHLFVLIRNDLQITNIKQAQQLGLSNAEKHLRECDLSVNDLLYKYDLVFPKRQFKGFVEEIEGDY